MSWLYYERWAGRSALDRKTSEELQNELLNKPAVVKRTIRRRRPNLHGPGSPSLRGRPSPRRRSAKARRLLECCGILAMSLKGLPSAAQELAEGRLGRESRTSGSCSSESRSTSRGVTERARSGCGERAGGRGGTESRRPPGRRVPGRGPTTKAGGNAAAGQRGGAGLRARCRRAGRLTARIRARARPMTRIFTLSKRIWTPPKGISGGAVPRSGVAGPVSVGKRKGLRRVFSSEIRGVCSS